jgi:hypothetical protein
MTAEPVAPDNLISILRQAHDDPASVTSWRDLVQVAAAALSAAREQSAINFNEAINRPSVDEFRALQADLARAREMLQKPTPEMIEAGKDERMECFKTDGRETNPVSVGEALTRIYVAMTSAGLAAIDAARSKESL